MEEAKDTIHITGKMIVVIFILLLLVVGTFGMFLLNASHNKISVTAQSGSNGDMPEKCKLPAGQDVNSWKEHLGHHTETQDCLKYFK